MQSENKVVARAQDGWISSEFGDYSNVICLVLARGVSAVLVLYCRINMLTQ